MINECHILYTRASIKYFSVYIVLIGLQIGITLLENISHYSAISTALRGTCDKKDGKAVIDLCNVSMGQHPTFNTL